jgi:hypothetical protein
MPTHRTKPLPSRKKAKDKRVKVDIPAEILGMTRSMFEARVLSHLINKGVHYEYESKVIPYVEPEHRRKYTPDIVLENKIIIEVKGKLDADDRKKMLLVKEQHPEYDIRFLFMRDNKLTKSSKTLYSTWAAKHGFPYAVSEDGLIPEDWINEPAKEYDID